MGEGEERWRRPTLNNLSTVWNCSGSQQRDAGRKRDRKCQSALVGARGHKVVFLPEGKRTAQRSPVTITTATEIDYLVCKRCLSQLRVEGLDANSYMPQAAHCGLGKQGVLYFKPLNALLGCEGIFRCLDIRQKSVPPFYAEPPATTTHHRSSSHKQTATRSCITGSPSRGSAIPALGLSTGLGCGRPCGVNVENIGWLSRLVSSTRFASCRRHESL